MKKIAGLLIGDECDQQLLGLDEKHDRLFIKKDQELILFSLDTFKVVGRFNHMGYPDSVIFTENGRYAAVVFRQGLSYRNKVYVIDLSEDPADIKFSYRSSGFLPFYNPFFIQLSQSYFNWQKTQSGII